MISFEHVGLRYSFGPEVLSDITFELEQGSYHFLSGPSGAGKSSLALQLMAWGADLVADDRTLLRERSDGAIEALAPPTLPPRQRFALNSCAS